MFFFKKREPIDFFFHLLKCQIFDRRRMEIKSKPPPLELDSHSWSSTIFCYNRHELENNSIVVGIYLRLRPTNLVISLQSKHNLLILHHKA